MRGTKATGLSLALSVAPLLLLLIIVAQTSVVVALTTAPMSSKVKHITMFTIQDDASEDKVEAMKKGLLGLPQLIPEITSHELGEDLKLPGGQNHPAGKNRSVVWSATFKSATDYETYETADAHVDVITNLIKPIIVPGSRAAIQYSIE